MIEECGYCVTSVTMNSFMKMRKKGDDDGNDDDGNDDDSDVNEQVEDGVGEAQKVADELVTMMTVMMMMMT